jgi:hypothetical protein
MLTILVSQPEITKVVCLMPADCKAKKSVAFKVWKSKH